MIMMVLIMAAGLVALLTLFSLVRGVFGLGGLPTALVLTAAIGLAYVPLGVLFWPGADIFAMQLVLFLGLSYLLGTIAHYRDDAARRQGTTPVRFHWVPATILGFFAFLFIALSGFVVVAEQGLPPALADRLLPEPAGERVARSAFPGTVARDLFRSEGQFDYVRQLEAQQQRGWSVEYGWVNQAPVPGQEARMRIKLHDREGNPLDGASVDALFMRPSDTREDQRVRARETDPGVYEGSVTLERAGQWLVLFEIERGDVRHEARGIARLEQGAPGP